MAAFSRAAAADTTFALAFYRLSIAQERLAWAEASRIDVQAAGHLQLAYLAMAHGQHRIALGHLDQAEAMGDPDARESRAWFLAMPWVDAAPGALADTVRALAMREQGATAESDNPSSFFSAQNGVHGLVNLYLRGILGAGAGHEDAAHGGLGGSPGSRRDRGGAPVVAAAGRRR